MSSFSGGTEALNTYVRSNLKYPASEKRSGIRKVVKAGNGCAGLPDTIICFCNHYLLLLSLLLLQSLSASAIIIYFCNHYLLLLSLSTSAIIFCFCYQFISDQYNTVFKDTQIYQRPACPVASEHRLVPALCSVRCLKFK